LAIYQRFRVFSWSDILKRPSLIKDEVMITVTNIHFYDIEGYGTKPEISRGCQIRHHIDLLSLPELIKASIRQFLTTLRDLLKSGKLI